MELQWPLMLFTLFVCLSAGIFGVAGTLAGLGRGHKLQLPAVLTALATLLVGGIASFFHLQHWDRIFNGFGHLTSGITQELIAILVFGVFACFYLYFAWRRVVPVWVGWIAVGISIVLVVVMAHSYAMVARPLWDNPLLWLYYLSNAVLLGGLCTTLIQTLQHETTRLSLRISLGSGVFALVILIVYMGFIPSLTSSFSSMGNYFDPTHPTKAMADPAATMSGFVFGEGALLFWLGAVVVGTLLPTLACYLMSKLPKNHGALLISVGILCALTGSICFRVLLYTLGFSVFAFY